MVKVLGASSVVVEGLNVQSREVVPPPGVVMTAVPSTDERGYTISVYVGTPVNGASVHSLPNAVTVGYLYPWGRKRWTFAFTLGSRERADSRLLAATAVPAVDS